MKDQEEKKFKHDDGFYEFAGAAMAWELYEDLTRAQRSFAWGAMFESRGKK